MSDLTNYAWKNHINYRQNPHAYKIGKGEQGVLICEPYKSEILPLWRFKTPVIARQSSQAIYQLFLNYLANDDFVGADMARKYLQMGFTRARRYTNYAGGKKYQGPQKKPLPKGTGDPIKAKSAEIFYKKWQMAEQHQTYQSLKKQWQQWHGNKK